MRSDNYFVLAVREKLPMLPYSVNEIYGFRKSGKFHEAQKTYNEIYHLYGELSEQSVIRPDVVITEDSNSGHEFFAKLSDRKKISCISANGKSNVISRLNSREKKGGTCLVIVDGAAFGSEIRDVSEYLNTDEGVVLYAPESFEWLLLSTNAIPNVNVSSILDEPEKYIDSSEYASWERYFTVLLIKRTQKDPVWAYSKKKLPEAYYSPKIISEAEKMMKLIVWDE